MIYVCGNGKKYQEMSYWRGIQPISLDYLTDLVLQERLNLGSEIRDSSKIEIESLRYTLIRWKGSGMATERGIVCTKVKRKVIQGGSAAVSASSESAP